MRLFYYFLVLFLTLQISASALSERQPFTAGPTSLSFNQPKFNLPAEKKPAPQKNKFFSDQPAGNQFLKTHCCALPVASDTIALIKLTYIDQPVQAIATEARHTEITALLYTRHFFR